MRTPPASRSYLVASNAWVLREMLGVLWTMRNAWSQDIFCPCCKDCEFGHLQK